MLHADATLVEKIRSCEVVVLLPWQWGYQQHVRTVSFVGDLENFVAVARAW